MNLAFIQENLVFIIPGAIGIVLGLGVAFYGLAAMMKRGNQISNRLDTFVAPETLTSDAESGRPLIIPREISGSLLNRTVVNWFKSLLQFLGKYTPQKMAVELEHKLLIAGNPGNLHARELYAIRTILAIIGVVVAFILNRDFSNLDLKSLALGLVVILVGWMLPEVWLNGKVRSRQDEILRRLPDALDMLSVCASAGLGFDQSLQKISDQWDTELGRELKRVTQEMEMGVPRSEALRNLGERLEVNDLSQFIAIIVQAEKVGMSYADVLHSQALQMRVQRQYRAREIANKLPGKMILPIATMIFPAILAVILGPAVPTLLNAF